MPDLTIKCADCQKEFVFTEGEKKFYDSKGLTQPKRCKPCRQARRESRENQQTMDRQN